MSAGDPLTVGHGIDDARSPLTHDGVTLDCPVYQARFVRSGRRQFAERRIFKRRIGLGGSCPSCDEPVSVTEWLAYVSTPITLRETSDRIELSGEPMSRQNAASNGEDPATSLNIDKENR